MLVVLIDLNLLLILFFYLCMNYNFGVLLNLILHSLGHKGPNLLLFESASHEVSLGSGKPEIIVYTLIYIEVYREDLGQT